MSATQYGNGRPTTEYRTREEARARARAERATGKWNRVDVLRFRESEKWEEPPMKFLCWGVAVYEANDAIVRYVSL